MNEHCFRCKHPTGGNHGLLDCITYLSNDNERLRADNARLREAVRVLVENHDALAGSRGHRLGCECGGTNDGKHSCATLAAAFNLARAALNGEAPNGK